jgi:hypothetical protein
MLRHQYDRLAEDGDLTDEARARRACELYERHRDGIERKKRAAQDTLVKAAKSAEKNSVTRPPGEALSSTDPTKLLLDQNEASRIIKPIERRKGQGPFRQDSGELLRQEYARGLDIGGVEGGAICRGVLRASQELGMGDDWLSSLRSETQHKSIDNARRLKYFSELISTEAPKPPRSLEKAAKQSRERSNRRTAPLLVPASGSPIPAPGGSSRATKKQRKKAR